MFKGKVSGYSCAFSAQMLFKSRVERDSIPRPGLRLPVDLTAFLRKSLMGANVTTMSL